tara:strand:- start:34052 stop:34558 length:507 start_codon:yes stop_codon:yes gene_type:complete
MPRVEFESLPADARVWIFAAERQLMVAEQNRLLVEVDSFIAQWGAHDAPLIAGRDLRYEQFLFVAVDQKAVGPSGCSIDALVRQIKLLEQDLDIEFVNHAPIMFRQGDEIYRVSRTTFSDLIESENVSLETVVFDNTVTRLGDVRDGKWELRARESWHGDAFFKVFQS